MLRLVLCLAFACTVAVAEQLTPLTPEASLAAIHVSPDLSVSLVASEPKVFDPVALCFDEHGAMYVVEDRGYPSGPGEGKPPAGTVALLRDLDGNGTYESRTTFADGFSFPNGILPWKGGVLLTDAPDVYFLKDSDGDGRADFREVVLHGFSEGGSTQLRVSHPTLAYDGWIYFTNGLSGGSIVDPRFPANPPLDMGANDLRWNPVTGELQATSGQAQFGLTFDDHGNKFVCSNRKHIELVVMQSGDLARNPFLSNPATTDAIPVHGEAAKLFPMSENRTTAFSHTGTFTAACGLHIFRGSGLPAPYYGNGFVCDPTGNLVHRDVLEQDGATLVARRGEEGSEFLASTDNWFRPVYVTTGPDGALYVCDMYRKTIEHPTYLPPDIAAKTDFEAGKDRGRIYRIGFPGAGTQRLSVRHFADRTVGNLLALSDHENGWVRDTAYRLLLDTATERDVPILRRGLKSDSRRFTPVYALYAVEHLKALTPDMAAEALASNHAGVREHTLRIARKHVATWVEFRSAVQSLATDPEPRVRFAAALYLGDDASRPAVSELATILASAPGDPWIQRAVLSGIHRHELAFAAALIPAQAPSPELAHELGRMCALADSPEAVRGLLQKIGIAELPKDAGWQLDWLLGVCEGGAQSSGWPRDRSVLEALLGESDGTANAAWLSACLQRSLDTATPASTRVQLISLLGFAPSDAALDTLLALTDVKEAEEIRVQAVQSLARLDEAQVGASLCDAERWPTYTPRVRGAALAGLFRSSDRLPAVIDALEKGTVEPWSLDNSQRSMLLNHPDAAMQARAKIVFDVVNQKSRTEAYETAKAMLTGDGQAAAGRVVYDNICANCHVYQGIGKSVGPELSDIRAQSAEAILKHIVDPNAEVSKGFEAYTLETVDGDTYTGVIAEQSEASVTIRQALGIEYTVPRTEIATIVSVRMSLMPEELEKALKPQELRDLMAFLRQ